MIQDRRGNDSFIPRFLHIVRKLVTFSASDCPMLVMGLIFCLQFAWAPSALAQLRDNQVYTVRVLDGPSFARVVVGTMPARPVTEPQRFQIVIRAFDYSQDQLETMIVQQLTIPTGSVSASVEVPYPPTSSSYWGGSTLLHVEQDGNRVFDVRRDMMTVDLGSRKQGMGYGITLLASSGISSSFETSWQVGRGSRQVTSQMQPNGGGGLPSLQYLEQIVMQEGYSVNYYNPPTAPATVGGQPTGTPISTCQTSDVFSGCPLGDLPQQWLGLVNVRNLLISWSDLKTLRASRPEACDALADWAAMGGHLFVYDCGDVTGDDRALMAVLVPGKNETGNSPGRGKTPWRVPSPELKALDSSASSYGFGDQEWVDYRSYAYYEEEAPDDTVDPTRLKLVEATSPDQEEMLVTDFGRGYLTCVRSDMSGWKSSEWMDWWNVQQMMSRSIMSEIGSNTLMHLLDPEFNIPTLSEPPRLAFQILITGFVLLVGPVFFIVFRRAKRLYLWLLMTPLVSLAACLGMVVFAIFYEGFDTKGRIASVTFLDHRSRVGSQQVRYAYYAGVQPSGYEFDSDFLICDSRRPGSSRAILTRGDDFQIIQGGDIRSRTEHQLTATRPVQLDALVTLFRDESGQPQLRNLSESPALYVVYRDAGQYYAAENLGVGQTVAATPVSVSELTSKYRSLLREHAPRQESRYSRYATFSGYYYGYPGRDWSDNNGGIIARLPEHLLNTDNDSIYPDRDGRYVAIFNELDSIPNPVPKALYDKYKFHVIVGQN